MAEWPSDLRQQYWCGLFFYAWKLDTLDETSLGVPLLRSKGHAQGCQRQPRAIKGDNKIKGEGGVKQ